MTEFPETQHSLLLQLRSNSDRKAWSEFAQLYQPVIYRIARRRGLQDADAQDLTQQIMVSIMGAIGRWEKESEHVRFRHWLRRVAKNAVLNSLTRARPDRAIGGTDIHELLNRQPAADDDDQLFEEEYRREVYHRASQIVQSDVEPETWEVFRLTVIEGVTTKEAASRLGKSTANIYAARSRIMKRLQVEVSEIEAAENER